MLSAIDQDRIEAAVAAAEEGSSGEIVCILAGEVSTYRETPLAFAAAVALAVPPIALALGLHPLALAAGGSAWTIGHASAVEGELNLALLAYAVAQVILFGVAALIASIPVVRRLLTPAFLKRHRVRKAAQQQYAAISSRAVGSDTGVLLFVALEDRMVEIVADAAIHAKCGEAVWKQAAAAIGAGMKSADPTDGIIKAVTLCGAALREHFPQTGPNTNVLSNRPMQI